MVNASFLGLNSIITSLIRLPSVYGTYPNSFMQRASNKYIKKVILNGLELKRNYITHDEISKGGKLVIVSAADPQPGALPETWISELK